MTNNIVKQGTTLKPGFKNWNKFVKEHVKNKDKGVIKNAKNDKRLYNNR